MQNIHTTKMSFRAWSLICLCLSISACDNLPRKTDSELFREDAIKQAQVPLDKAQGLLEEINSQPLDNVDDLVLVSNLTQEAKAIYARSHIINHQDSKLKALDVFLDELEPTLVSHAKALLHDTVSRTQTLRKQIEDAKSQPYSAKSQDTGGLVAFLGETYNKDVKACCLRKLGQIEQVLARNAKKHRQLIILMRSINDELGKVIQTKEYAAQLHRRIDGL